MKKYFTLALMLGVGLVSAQDAVTVVANETCDCVSNLNATNQKITDIQLGLCMVKAYSAHKNEMPPHLQVSISDAEGFEPVAAEIGIKMMETCPEIIMTLAESGAFEDEFAEMSDISVSGSVLEVKTDQFMVLEIKDDQGKKFSMLLFYHFAGASLLTEGKIKKGDRVTASYSETELYDPKIREFRTFKILTALSK